MHYLRLGLKFLFGSTSNYFFEWWQRHRVIGWAPSFWESDWVISICIDVFKIYKYASIYEFDIFNNTNWERTTPNFYAALTMHYHVGELVKIIMSRRIGEIHRKESKMHLDPYSWYKENNYNDITYCNQGRFHNLRVFVQIHPFSTKNYTFSTLTGSEKPCLWNENFYSAIAILLFQT